MDPAEFHRRLEAWRERMRQLGREEKPEPTPAHWSEQEREEEGNDDGNRSDDP